MTAALRFVLALLSTAFGDVDALQRHVFNITHDKSLGTSVQTGVALVHLFLATFGDTHSIWARPVVVVPETVAGDVAFKHGKIELWQVIWDVGQIYSLLALISDS